MFQTLSPIFHRSSVWITQVRIIARLAMGLLPLLLNPQAQAEISPLTSADAPTRGASAPWLAEFRAHRHQVTESTSSPASVSTTRLSELGAVVARRWNFNSEIEISIGLALDYGFGESPSSRRTHVFLAPQLSLAYRLERSYWRLSFEPLLWGEETLTASMIDTRRRDWRGHRMRIAWLAQVDRGGRLWAGPTISFESRRSSEEQVGSQPPTNSQAEASSWRPGVSVLCPF
jgi:hypothetical protein